MAIDSHTTVRQPLPKKLFKELGEQFHNLRGKPLETYTMERINSSYPDAKADLTIYDPENKLILHGREFGGGRSFFWMPS